MSQGEKITDRAFIYVLLKRFIQNRSLLVANVPGTAGQYNTTILAIDEDRQRLVLDELSHPRGHEAVVREKTLTIRGTQRGVRVDFTVTVTRIDQSDKIAQYEVQFPTHVMYYQKRQNYRVNVSADIAFPVRLINNGAIYQGKVADLSETGLCVIVPNQVSVNRGDAMEECLLHLPNGGRLFCKLRVCHIEYNDKHNMTQLGCKIIDMESSGHRAYQRAIQYVQREMIRRQARVN